MTLLFVHAFATLFMTGVIWFVQVVHYPLFAAIAPGEFPTYERRHTHLTTFVVLPPMFIELIAAGWLAFAPPTGIDQRLAWIGFGLAVLLWLSTFLIQVPCHRALEKTHDARVIRRLVQTNWLRTVVWSVRAVLCLLMIPSGS